MIVSTSAYTIIEHFLSLLALGWMLVRSIAIGNALAAYNRLKYSLKIIGTCTNNHAVSIYARNSENVASKVLFLYYKVCFMFNGTYDRYCK